MRDPRHRIRSAGVRPRRQLRDDHRTDEEAHELLESCRSGRDYEWPIDEEDEIALLLLAANDGEVTFDFRISEL